MESAYAFDLKLVCGGYGYFSTFTIGNKPDHEGLETRTPSEVSPELFANALKELGLNHVIVDDDTSYYDWTCIQGWAMVDWTYAREKMGHWLKKHKCLISPYSSYTDIELASQSVRKRTFRGKFKQRILDRDKNRCVLCGETANLTLQHVLPYSQGGETSHRNLVTLCEPCNQEMGQEYNRELYSLAGLRSYYEPSLLRNCGPDQPALTRALQFSNNIMHARCELY